jgi:hypothetical protein
MASRLTHRLIALRIGSSVWRWCCRCRRERGALSTRPGLAPRCDDGHATHACDLQEEKGTDKVILFCSNVNGHAYAWCPFLLASL